MKMRISMTVAALLLINGLSHAQPETSDNFSALSKNCAPNVHQDTMQALVRVESKFNPLAIGVVKGAVKQPTTFAEAVEVAKALHANGKNFSLGLGQINVHNLDRFGLTFERVFDPCTNLQTASAILSECYNRATGDAQESLQKALSCYYSGNFKTGFMQDLKGLPSYVERIKEAALQNTDGTTIQIPKLDPSIKLNVANAIQSSAKVKVKAEPLPKTKTEINTEIKTAEQRPKAKWDAFGDW